MPINKSTASSIFGSAQSQPVQASTSAASPKQQKLANIFGGQAATVSPPKQEKIFEGGALNKIIDAVSVFSYGVGGVLSPDLTIGEAIRTRTTPKDVLGIKNPFIGFVVDVITDPLTYIGGLGLTTKGINALKAGNLATTLGGGAKAGQRALLAASIPFTDISVPLIKGEGILSGLTKAGNILKGGFDGAVGRGLEKTLGLLPESKMLIDEATGIKYDPVTGLKGIEGIEAIATTNKQARQAIKTYKTKSQLAEAFAIERVAPIKKVVDDGLKAGRFTGDDLVRFAENVRDYAAGATKNFRKLPPVLSKAFDDMKPIVDDANAAWKEVLGEAGLLKGKGLTNVALPKKGKAAVGAKVLSEEAGEKFSSFSKIGGDIAETSKGKGRILSSDEGITKIQGVAGEDVWIKDVDKRVLDGLIEDKKYLERRIQELSGRGGTQAASRKSALNQQLKDVEEQIFSIRKSGMERTGAKSTEVNDALRALGLDPVFKEDVFEELFASAAGAERAGIRREIIEGLTKQSDIVKEIPKTGVPVGAGMRRLKIKGLEGYMATNAVADALETVHFGYSQLGPLEDAMRLWHGVQGQLKKLLTFVNVAFHTRNAVSNVWLASQGGVKNPKNFFKGYELLWKVGKLRKQGLQGKELFKKLGADGDLYERFIQNGLGGVGRFAGDIEKTLKGEPWVFEMGGRAGTYIEDSSKLGMFNDLIKQGFTDEAAATQVRKFLFDYSDITDVERVLFKAAVPFYTWMRKNIPLQMAMLIQKPGSVSVIGKAQSAIQDMVGGEPLPPELLPEWMREGYAFYLGENPNGTKNYLRLEGFIPSVDVSKVFRPLDLIFEGGTPLIKNPAEIIMNYNSFFEREIKEYEGERRKIFGQDIPILSDPYVNHLLRLARPISEIERVLGLEEFAPEGGTTPLQKGLRFVGGINIKQFDEEKQKKALQYVIDTEVKKAKKGLSEAEKRGDIQQAEELRLIIQELEQGIGVSL